MDDNTLEYFTLSDSMRMYIRDIEAQRGELLEVLEKIKAWDIENYAFDIPLDLRKAMQEAIAKAKGEV